MYNLTGDVVQAIALVFIVTILCVLRTMWRFFKKSSNRFLLDAFLRSVLFVIILALLYRNPIFETKTEKIEHVLSTGTTRAQIIQSEKSAVLEVNKVAGVLLEILRDFETGRVTVARPSDIQKIKNIRTYLETGVWTFNIAVAEEMGLKTSRDFRQLLAPLERVDERYKDFMLQGNKGRDITFFSQGGGMVPLEKAAVVQRRAHQLERYRSRQDVSGQVSLRIQQGLLQSATSAARVGEMSSRVMDRMVEIANLLRGIQVTTNENQVQVVTVGVSTAPETAQQTLVNRFLRNVGEYITDLSAVSYIRESASQLYNELQAYQSIPKTFEKKIYSFAEDVLKRFHEFDHLVAGRKIRELLSQTYHIGDIIHTTYLVARGKTKVLLENIALDMTTSVFGDDLVGVILGFLQLVTTSRKYRLTKK